MDSRPTLSYAPANSPPAAPAILRLCGATALFSVCEWLTEFVCQQVHLQHLIRTAASGHAAAKAEDHFLFDMIIETGIALMAAIVFFAGQAALYPWRTTRVLTVWPLTVVLGTLVSLMGWEMWRRGVEDASTLTIRLSCALLFGVLVSWTRRIRG